jgi:hypothetical protein
MPDIVDDDGVVNPLSYVETKRGRRQRFVSVIVANTESGASVWLFLEGNPDRGESNQSLLGRSAPRVRLDPEWIAQTIRRHNNIVKLNRTVVASQCE